MRNVSSFMLNNDTPSQECPQGWINPWAKGAAALGPRFYRAPTFDFGFFFNPFLII